MRKHQHGIHDDTFVFTTVFVCLYVCMFVCMYLCLYAHKNTETDKDRDTDTRRTQTLSLTQQTHSRHTPWHTPETNLHTDTD